MKEYFIKAGQFVDGVVYKFSPLGVNVLVNNKVDGLLYKNELFQKLNIGDKVRVFVKNVREDGKLDLALQQGGYKNSIDDSTNTIIALLTDAGGFLPFNDKSDPEEIQRRFRISKKKFKDALGLLYKKRKIEITNEGIRLIDN
jgi:predicted RNA-binding protein (virulence factor B family)